MQIKTPNLGREEGLRVSVTTDAASEPVSTADMKSYLKVDYNDDDDEIDEMVVAARKFVEGYIGRKLGSQTLKATWTKYHKLTRLPYAPINSVTTVKTIDQDTETTLTEDSDYYVLGGDVDKYLEFSSAGSTGLEVVYTAGYTTIPDAIIKAIKRLVAKMYEFRGDDVEPIECMDAITKSLLAQYRVPRL